MRSGIRFFLKTHNVFCWVPRWLTGIDWRLLMNYADVAFRKMHTHLWVISLLDLGGLCLGGCFRLRWLVQALTRLKSLPCLCRVPLGSWLMQLLVLLILDQMFYLPQCSVLEFCFLKMCPISSSQVLESYRVGYWMVELWNPVEFFPLIFVMCFRRQVTEHP